MSAPPPPRKGEAVKRAHELSYLAIAMVFFANAANATVSQQARALIERVTGGKGTYAADDGVYRVVFPREEATDRKSTRLNSSHGYISYAVFCLKKKKKC